jgi:phosphoserine/homoserine phosphotransferase
MSDRRPTLIAADLEGVFLPEVWIAVAEATGIDRLRLTTRDVSDYAELMAIRMQILREIDFGLDDIQAVIETMVPLPGAVAFLDWVRARAPMVILTDSFYEFVNPFMAKLNYPTVFAHRLITDEANMLTGYELRIEDSKRRAMESFSELGFRTLAFGDSFNDISMLEAADQGVFFRPPANVTEIHPDYPVAWDYEEIKGMIVEFQEEAKTTK